MRFNRLILPALAVAVATATPLFAQEAAAPAAEAAKPGLLTVDGGLMFWTLLVFGILFFVLSKYAFGPITQAVRAREQQQELLARARRDIDSEKTAAIAELRREAVGLAIAAAGKVIEKNLDDAQNRKLVEGYLAGIQ